MRSRPPRLLVFSIAFGLALALLSSFAVAQPFTKISDPLNPIAADPGATFGTYTGCSWVDYDSDGWPDLFVDQRGLYRNLGGGQFVKVPGAQLPGDSLSLGNSWADVDNDGDPDVFLTGNGGTLIAGKTGSFFYRNDRSPGDLTGNGPFTKVTTGVIGDSLANGGWACAFGDYDNDGYADLVVAGLTNFATLLSNHLLHNEADGTFTRDTATDVDDVSAPFTVPSWSDFDQDGDVDLFIGSGPATGALGPDYCYRNRTIEGGAPRLERLTGVSPFIENRDGQIWNWIDYDNDGDLDVYITNYGGGFPGIANDLFRNDAGVFHKLTSTDVGLIVSDRGLSLASVWGDFDDDGDLDCLVTNDSSSLRNKFYRNDVDSTGKFTSLSLGALTADIGPHYGTCAADYDCDGDLDLFVSGVAAQKGLFRNDRANGLNWAEFKLVGAGSNRSALGARVSVRAVIKGQARWQMREVSAQNSFNGHNDFTQHFGLREAVMIDSVRIAWPSGRVEVATGLAANAKYDVREGEFGATPTALAVDEAAITDGGAARIVWSGGVGEATTAAVERSADQGASWPTVALVSLDGARRFVFEDVSVEPGRRYGYRLAVTDREGTVRSAATWLDVPGVPAAPAPAFGFAHAIANPMPAGSSLTFAVRVAAGLPARLDLFDLSGRTIAGRALEGFSGSGASVQQVTLAAERTPAPGVYWAVLSQGATRAKHRVVLVR